MNKISWWRTNFDQKELSLISDAIANEHISQGVVTEQFEEDIAEYLGVPYVVATTSGSMAILMALMSLGIGPGHEVIVPNRTWIATAHAVLMAGAKVKFVDVEEDRPIIDVSKIEEKITNNTKAIIPVHLNGCSAAMDEISSIAKKYGLFIIEDAAQAFGSKNSYGYLGTQSDAGCFSLSVAKIISTGQGGFVVTRNENIYQILRSIRTHGVSNVICANWTRLGFNFRFTDILASIGRAQIMRMPERIENVRNLYAYYKSEISNFSSLKLLPVNVNKGEIPIYVEILCSERDKLVNYLETKGIQTRPFYPDLDKADYFMNMGEFPNSRKFADQGLFLPCGPKQPIENAKCVIKALKSWNSQ